MTRGALYHHFHDKEDLFRAVLDEVEGEVVPSLWRRSGDRHASAWDLFRANSEVYLDAASTNPAYRQIVLVDGPAVLGWNAWSEHGDGPTNTIIGYLPTRWPKGSSTPNPSSQRSPTSPPWAWGRPCTWPTPTTRWWPDSEISECNERFLSALGVRPGEADQ